MDESVVLKVLGETENTKTIIRLAVKEDFERIRDICATSRQLMLDSGNIKEWSRVFPEDVELQDDIEAGKGFVISFWEYKEAPIPEDNGKKKKKKKGDAPEEPQIIIEETIHACFFFDTEKNEHYNNIYRGQWLNDDEYGRLYNLASDGEFSGIYAAVLGYIIPLVKNVRVDTVDENEIMTSLLLKSGFEKCGTVIGDHGVPTVGYQFICPEIEPEEPVQEAPVSDEPENEETSDKQNGDETVVVE